ncbi:TPA: hypothetical protein R5S02_003183 [Salmonella enterica]|nr:hypothetical protein [Salmonella enterica]
MKIKKYFPLCFALALSGCKIDLSTTVNMDDVTSKQHSATTADLNFEVAACNDYEDSRKESRSLIEAKGEVPGIFNGAEYVECFNKKFTSYAHFRVPVEVGAVTDRGSLVNPNAELFITSSEDDGGLAVIYLSNGLIKKLNDAKKRAAVDFDFDIRVTITPPKQPIKVVVAGVFLTAKTAKGSDELPVAIAATTWADSSTLTFKLSDVATAQLFETGRFDLLIDESKAPQRVTAK